MIHGLSGGSRENELLVAEPPVRNIYGASLRGYEGRVKLLYSQMLVSNSPSGTLDWNSSITHLYPRTPWVIICIIFSCEWPQSHVLLGEAQMKCCLLALETTNRISCTTRCFLHHLGQSLADKIILDAISSLHTPKIFKRLVIEMISVPDSAPVIWDVTPGM